MNFLIGILILFLNLVIGTSYLSNTNLEYNISQMEIDLWFDLPLSGYHNSYPPTGINCATGYDDESIVYLISSQSLLNRHGDYERCFLQKRTVSIFKRDLNFVKINYGSYLLFNQNLPHGNLINRTNETRVSLNCRFKGLFTPYMQKDLGSFFSPLKLRAATKLGLEYKLPG